MTATFLRPPSVEEYERMTQRMRLAAAEALADQLASIEVKRRKPRPPVRDPEETRMLAHALLPIVARRWPDPPHVQRDRLRAAADEAQPLRKAAQ
jgi:malic enzyme